VGRAVRRASVRVAAFTADDPDDRERIDAHMANLLESPEVTLRAATSNGQLVGSIASGPLPRFSR
jgi:hypothetical protein